MNPGRAPWRENGLTTGRRFTYGDHAAIRRPRKRISHIGN